MKNNKRGFSLIELLITLTIISIIAAFSLPSLNSIWQKSTAAILQNELQQAIHTAKENAFTLGLKTRICPSADTKTCSGDWQNGFIVLSQENQLIFAYQNFSAQGVLHWRGFRRDQKWIDFIPQTNPIWENGTFWYCTNVSANPLWALAMNKFGSVRELHEDKWGKIFDSHHHILNC